MLIPCPECDNPCAQDATACPKCGKPLAEVAAKKGTPKRRIDALGCVIGVFGLIVLVGIFATLGTNRPTQTYRTPTNVRASEGMGAPDSVPAPPRNLLRMSYRDYHWCQESGYAIATGRVTNISSVPLDNVMAVVEFEAKDGSLITSSDSMIDYQPILPGQSSPFTVMETWNPAMAKGTAGVSFKTVLGEPIGTEYK